MDPQLGNSQTIFEEPVNHLLMKDEQQYVIKLKITMKWLTTSSFFLKITIPECNFNQANIFFLKYQVYIFNIPTCL